MQKENNLADATKVVKALASRGLTPFSAIYSDFIGELSKNGEVDLLSEIETFISEEMKAATSFHNRTCFAHVVTGQAEQYLQKLDDEISAVTTDEQAVQIEKTFPVGGINGILEKHPELLPKCL